MNLKYIILIINEIVIPLTIKIYINKISNKF